MLWWATQIFLWEWRIFSSGALSQLGTALKGHYSFRGAHGVGRGVCWDYLTAQNVPYSQSCSESLLLFRYWSRDHSLINCLHTNLRVFSWEFDLQQELCVMLKTRNIWKVLSLVWCVGEKKKWYRFWQGLWCLHIWNQSHVIIAIIFRRGS